jgi:hypothetical protein
MQTELEKWIDVSKVTESTVIVGEKSQCFGDLVEPMIPERLVRALLAGKVLCDAEPIGYLYQHEDTGMTASVDVQQVEWGFEKNNPRYTLVGPLHKPADIGKE